MSSNMNNVANAAKQNVPETDYPSKTKYNNALIGKPFSQCEILFNVTIPIIKFDSESPTFNPSEIKIESVNLKYCMVMSQECDLHRQAEKGNILRHIVLCELRDLTNLDRKELAKTLIVSESKLDKALSQNQFQRYGYLEELKDESGIIIPELLADFRLIYGIQPEFLDYQMEKKQSSRLIKLNPPYKEHFSQRFYFYQNRIGLPEDYTSIS